jgi:hypothetical protein
MQSTMFHLIEANDRTCPMQIRMMAASMLLCATPLSGCVMVSSDAPMYDASQSVRDPSLQGWWKGAVVQAQPPRDMTIDLALAPAGGYRMIIDDTRVVGAEQSTEFANVDLVSIGKRLFVFGRDGETGAQSASTWWPNYRLTHRGQYLAVDFIDATEMHRQFAQNLERYPHDWQEGRVSIEKLEMPPPDAPDGEIKVTINGFSPAMMHVRFSKDELQRYLIKHEYDERVFRPVATLKKQAE